MCVLCQKAEVWKRNMMATAAPFRVCFPAQCPDNWSLLIRARIPCGVMLCAIMPWSFLGFFLLPVWKGTNLSLKFHWFQFGPALVSGHTVEKHFFSCLNKGNNQLSHLLDKLNWLMTLKSQCPRYILDFLNQFRINLRFQLIDKYQPIVKQSDWGRFRRHGNRWSTRTSNHPLSRCLPETGTRAGIASQMALSAWVMSYGRLWFGIF